MNDFPTLPFVEYADLEQAKKHIPLHLHATATQLHENGYAVIEFPDAEIVDRAARITRELEPQFNLKSWIKTGWNKSESLRVTDFWMDNSDIRSIATNETVLELLFHLYGRPAFPFQTLNFPIGTQQKVHSDTIYFNSIPERWMCGVWLALEDIDEENGPLIYYPGSHRWPILWGEHIGLDLARTPMPGQNLFDPHWQKQIIDSNIKPQTLKCKKGQAIIWMANLLHGGARQIDPNRTRWSQVTHYYFEGCTYWRPYASTLSTGDIFSFTPPNIVENRVYELSEMAKRQLPSEFDGQKYKDFNPDLAAFSVAHAAEHWIVSGQYENRRYK